MNRPATQQIIQDTIQTVKTFSPALALDKNTLKSVIREALISPEGGLSYQTIRQLADTQRSIASSTDIPTILTL